MDPVGVGPVENFIEIKLEQAGFVGRASQGGGVGIGRGELRFQLQGQQRLGEFAGQAFVRRKKQALDQLLG